MGAEGWQWKATGGQERLGATVHGMDTEPAKPGTPTGAKLRLTGRAVEAPVQANLHHHGRIDPGRRDVPPWQGDQAALLKWKGQGLGLVQEKGKGMALQVGQGSRSKS